MKKKNAYADHGVMYWMDRAVEKYDEVWPILMKIDMSKASEHADKMAQRKHFELLKANRNPLKRVPTISSLSRGYMKGLNWIAAIGVTKILDTIKEGETIIYGGLEFSRVEGDVITTYLTMEEAHR